MCGICGLVAPAGPGDPSLVDRMNAALVHRGPDDGSVDAFGRCVLGHRRLRVVDLVTGGQPVRNESNDVVAVFNGELYNFRQLRSELGRKRHIVPGSGDTAVIPHLYEEHGLGFVERLSGMFAIALWDAQRERLVLARDRVGKKPLLWTRLPDGTFAFASELKALLRLPGLPRELDPPALDAFLALQYVPGTATGLRGIHKLAPGHLLVVENGTERIERYAQLRRLEPRDDDEWIDLVRERVGSAVRRRLIADVPLGALLSGGIDSSVVVALMAQESSEPVRTFTVGFGDDPRYDERRYARAVAERYSTQHEELVLEPDAPALLPRLAETFDEPFGDEAALPTLLISEVARRHVTVALTGDGGDESFAGYERYAAHALAGRLSGTPGLAAAAGTLRTLGPREPRSTATRAARLLEAAASPPGERYARMMEVFPLELRGELWEPDFVSPAPVRLEPAEPGIAALQLLDVETYLPGDLLPKADLASMACSLELRSPLLDWEVLELGISLPDRLKIRRRRGKDALRRAFARDLPPEIAGRRKTGFGVPLARWFRGELRDFAHEVLLDSRVEARGQLRRATVERLLREHAEGRADHGHRLWCLVMLELWQRTHLEASRPVPVAAVAG